MTEKIDNSLNKDRFGLDFGIESGQRRAALIDPETGEMAGSERTDTQVTSRIIDGAHALMRLMSFQGRVFVKTDDAILLAAYIVAVASSEDTIRLFDAIREGKITLAELKTRIDQALSDAKKAGEADADTRAKAQAQADAESFAAAGRADSDNGDISVSGRA